MSFIGAALAVNVIVPPDRRPADAVYWQEDAWPSRELNLLLPDEDPLFLASFASQWWPNSGGFFGDGGADYAMLDTAVWWIDMYPASGASGRFSYEDTVRDQSGNPVTGATVRCFVASSGELTATTVTDANGLFVVSTPHFVPHFLTAHKAGAPNIAGASAELVPPT